MNQNLDKEPIIHCLEEFLERSHFQLLPHPPEQDNIADIYIHDSPQGMGEIFSLSAIPVVDEAIIKNIISYLDEIKDSLTGDYKKIQITTIIVVSKEMTGEQTSLNGIMANLELDALSHPIVFVDKKNQLLLTNGVNVFLEPIFIWLDQLLTSNAPAETREQVKEKIWQELKEKSAFLQIQKELSHFLLSGQGGNTFVPISLSESISLSQGYSTLFLSNKFHMLSGVYIIDMSQISEAEFQEKINALSVYLNKVVTKLELRSALVNLVLLDSTNKGFALEYMANALPFDDEGITFIPLLVELEREIITQNPTQPHNSLQVNQAIENILAGRLYSMEEEKTKKASAFLGNKYIEAPSTFTTTIILTNVLIYFIFLFMSVPRDSLFQEWLANLIGFNPSAFSALEYAGMLKSHSNLSISLGIELFTSMFMHGNLAHLASNTLGIYIFGARLEKTIGPFATFFLYITAACLGGLSQMPFLGVSGGIGASGGVYGLVGAALAYTLIFKEPLRGLSNDFLIVYGVLGIALGFLYPNTGNAAHVGGFVAGLLLGILYFNLRKRKAFAASSFPV